VSALGVRHHLLSLAIVATAASVQPTSICSFCSRLRRGLLYSCARRHGYTALVLGQHLDDLAESFVMGAFNNGKLTTMKAHYLPTNKKGLRVIRPLVHTRESELRAFARDANLPVIEDNCPACFEAPLERARIKRVLAQQVRCEAVARQTPRGRARLARFG
jgi:tRNA(Ile)-lysidine synthase TilS/MesJ